MTFLDERSTWSPQSLRIDTSQQHSTLICLDADLMFALSHAFYAFVHFLHSRHPAPNSFCNSTPLCPYTTLLGRRFLAFRVCDLEFMEFRRFGHTHTRYEIETH